MIYRGPIFLYKKKKDSIQSYYFLYRNYFRIIFLIIMIFINANFPQNILIDSILFIDVTSLYTDPEYKEKIKVLKVLMGIENLNSMFI
jgi:hypothetical protein